MPLQVSVDKPSIALLLSFWQTVLGMLFVYGGLFRTLVKSANRQQQNSLQHILVVLSQAISTDMVSSVLDLDR